MFKQRGNLHAGMARKPLEAYHPNAKRSRLPQPTIVMPYKNSSQIVIGDRRYVLGSHLSIILLCIALAPTTSVNS